MRKTNCRILTGIFTNYAKKKFKQKNLKIKINQHKRILDNI